MLQKEKEAAERLQQEEELKVAAALALSASMEDHQTEVTAAALPLVVSPPLAPNLTSLLTGCVGRESETVPENGNTSTAADTVANEIGKSQKKKKTKKTKSNKQDNASKRDCSNSALKKSSFTTSTPAITTSAKEYKHEQVFYEAGMELKGEDKHGVYVKQIRNLLKNIQLVNPTAIMHAVVESGNSKPLGSKAEMNTNMTIFLAYASVGNNANAFKPKKNNNNKKGRKGKDKLDTLDPSVYATLIFLSDVDPNTIVSCVMHEFCHVGRFYFCKKQLQCAETVTPFIINYLYTFNDNATLNVELSSILDKAHPGLESNFMLPEEFEHMKIPEINIRQGIPKIPGQPGAQFCDYSREMQEAQHAHLIECNVQAIPFLRLLINYIKDKKLTTPIWGGHAHITETVDWDSPKSDVGRFVWMSQDHMCYNMSVVSINHGITDLNATAEVLCPESGNVLGHLSLQETLMKYLKLHDSNPMVTELHQRGPQGPVDMVMPNSSKAKPCFEMFNKQPAGYLYHVLPLFGAMRLFVKNILHWLMDAGLATEAPLCTYDEETQILTTPCDAQQENILSDVCSLPFFKDIHATKQAADANTKGRKKEHTAPKMYFQIGSACSVQTVHGAHNGKYSKVTVPGIELGMGTQAFAANLNAKKPVIEIASENDASSSERSGESSDT